MNTASQSWRRRFAIPLAAAAGYLAAGAVALLAGWALEAERQASEQARFGTLLAAQLAARSEEPLLRQDRVSLGVVARQATAQAEVRQVAIHTMDGRPFVVAGDPPGPDAAAFVQPVLVADEVAAEVRVALNEEAFQMPFAHSLAIAWPFWAVGLSVTLVLALFGGRAFAWWRGVQVPDAETPAPPPPETAEPMPGATVVVANLFVDAATPRSACADALAAVAGFADQVARVYGADAAALPGTGCALTFRDEGGDSDRHFNAVCATLLLRRLLERWQAAVAHGQGGTAEHPFRYAADHFARTVPPPAELPGSDAASAVLLLSSFVHNGEIVIGEAVVSAMAAPERLVIEALENPAAAALTNAAKPSGLVRGVAQEYEPLLDAQASEISAALGLPLA